jgi:hypothetical protein
VKYFLASEAENYEVRQFIYAYHSAYGSAEIDHDGKENSSSPVKVGRVEVSPDRLKVRVHLDDWRAGYVTAVRILEVTSDEGRSLWHDTFYYTLNHIPD